MASQLLGWDHLEWWVGNARAVTAWLTSGFGFEVVAYAGPETGVSDRVSYVLAQGARPLRGHGRAWDPTARWPGTSSRHGDGIRHLAWRVDDAAATATLAAAKGATVVADPITRQDDARIGDDRCHRDLRRDPAPLLWSARPGTTGGGPASPPNACRLSPAGDRVGLTSIDHVVGNVEEGRLDEWVDWYIEVLGLRRDASFRRRPDLHPVLGPAIHGGAQRRRHRDAHQRARTRPQEEPDRGIPRGLPRPGRAAHRPGHTRHRHRRRIHAEPEAYGSWRCPTAYYEDARARVPAFDLPWTDLQRLDIEVDVDSGGYLLQIFTETVDRPAHLVRRDHPARGCDRVR